MEKFFWSWRLLYPGASSCDYDFIPKKNETFRGIRYRTFSDILTAMDHTVITIIRIGTASCILHFPHRWKQAADNVSDYHRGIVNVSNHCCNCMVASIKFITFVLL
ncbi:hypothetical protein AVEN_99170-1 [Araneus ventricosus]|uniref:Uncharacterized protein n=1 Tax=Araneus ventricosus TaxID=182803 RepID=A0A4Y2CKZ6_ARAVE|nr:hypothetical protein AVEN_99170-1 [Araneus ventricosus]